MKKIDIPHNINVPRDKNNELDFDFYTYDEKEFYKYCDDNELIKYSQHLKKYIKFCNKLMVSRHRLNREEFKQRELFQTLGIDF